MELKECFGFGAFIVSLGSIALAIIALRRTTSHNAEIRQYASAAPDIALWGQINQARMMMASIYLKFAEITKGKPDDKLTEKEQKQILDVQLAYSQAVETLLSSYDLACRLYLDGSVERGRFRRQYEADVRKLVEDGTDTDKEQLSGIASPYKALRAVYAEWFNKEK